MRFTFHSNILIISHVKMSVSEKPTSILWLSSHTYTLPISIQMDELWSNAHFQDTFHWNLVAWVQNTATENCFLLLKSERITIKYLSRKDWKIKKLSLKTYTWHVPIIASKRWWHPLNGKQQHFLHWNIIFFEKCCSIRLEPHPHQSSYFNKFQIQHNTWVGTSQALTTPYSATSELFDT